MICDLRLCRAQQLQNILVTPTRSYSPPHQKIQQIIVGKRQQFLETIDLLGSEADEILLVEALQYQVQFQQSAPAMPPDFIQLGYI